MNWTVSNQTKLCWYRIEVTCVKLSWNALNWIEPLFILKTLCLFELNLYNSVLYLIIYVMHYFKKCSGWKFKFKASCSIFQLLFLFLKMGVKSKTTTMPSALINSLNAKRINHTSKIVLKSIRSFMYCFPPNNFHQLFMVYRTYWKIVFAFEAVS